jgi:hypothetical protein
MLRYAFGPFGVGMALSLGSPQSKDVNIAAREACYKFKLAAHRANHIA